MAWGVAGIGGAMRDRRLRPLGAVEGRLTAFDSWTFSTTTSAMSANDVLRFADPGFPLPQRPFAVRVADEVEGEAISAFSSITPMSMIPPDAAEETRFTYDMIFCWFVAVGPASLCSACPRKQAVNHLRWVFFP